MGDERQLLLLETPNQTPGDAPADGSGHLNKIVNVASVPHRSPFRYPGGKTWLVPRVRQWLQSRGSKANLFVEPFAGGGIVSLTVAFERLASHVLMVELDDQVGEVWDAIINRGMAEELVQKIAGFSCTRPEVERLLGQESADPCHRAFQTIVRNRVNRGGILAPGAGFIKTGENGRGIGSRWYGATLQRRIREIGLIRDRLTFLQRDGLGVIAEHAGEEATLFFVDPPYTASGKSAGSRLYRHSDLDHRGLFALMSQVKGDFLMTYDNAAEIHELAQQFGFDTQPIAMKSSHHARMTELLIAPDLSWIRAE